MAQILIHDIISSTTSAAVDDYAIIDGATNGTRKILVSNLGGGSGGVAGVISLTDAATILVDATLFSVGKIGVVTLGGNRTLGNPSGAVDGQNLQFRFRQDGTGNRTLALGSKYRFTGVVTTFSLNGTAGSVTYLSVRYNQADDRFDIVGSVPPA